MILTINCIVGLRYNAGRPNDCKFTSPPEFTAQYAWHRCGAVSTSLEGALRVCIVRQPGERRDQPA